MKSREEYKAKMRDRGKTPVDIASSAKVSLSTLYKFFRNDPTLHANQRGRIESVFEELGSSKVSA